MKNTARKNRHRTRVLLKRFDKLVNVCIGHARMLETDQSMHAFNQMVKIARMLGIVYIDIEINGNTLMAGPIGAQ